MNCFKNKLLATPSVFHCNLTSYLIYSSPSSKMLAQLNTTISLHSKKEERLACLLSRASSSHIRHGRGIGSERHGTLLVYCYGLLQTIMSFFHYLHHLQPKANMKTAKYCVSYISHIPQKQITILPLN